MNEPVGSNYPYGTTRYRLIDRVRWSAVVAGLAAALATMIVLSFLGLAIGLTTYDVGDRTQPFRIGVGVWALISGVISFFLGGWVAARTAVATGDSGTLNGTMVWCAAIPLMALLFASGVASMVGTAASTSTGEHVIRAASQMPGAEPATGADATGTATTPGTTTDAQQAKTTATKAAWWTLASLLVGLGASAIGGYAGQRSDHSERTTTTLPPPITPG
jgi:hypothetical protein